MHIEQNPYHETKHSMLRRCKGWNYKGRGIYMITLVARDRKAVFGKLNGEREKVHLVPSKLGESVSSQIDAIPSYYPQIEIIAKQLMPDHLHMLLFVHEPLTVHIGRVIDGFKVGTNRAYRQINGLRSNSANTEPADMNIPHSRSCVSAVSAERSYLPGLWEEGYHDRILTHKGQLGNMKRYILDNPRRLALKRANPDLFKIRQQMNICGVACTAMGNMFLAEYPQRQVLQCSRRLRQAEIDAKREECLLEAEKGTIFISAAISEGEKQICWALREAGFPLIVLLSGGFPSPNEPHYQYYKPKGVYFEACAAGRLLLIEPDKSLSEQPEIAEQVVAKAGEIPHDCLRYKFLALNAIAEMISKDNPASKMPDTGATDENN